MKKILFFLMVALFCIPWAANAQQSLPYSYGFEDNNLTTDGWELQGATNTEGTKIYNYSSLAHSGEYLFGFAYNEHSAYLMSPILTGGENGVVVSFYYTEYSDEYGDEQFQVGYTTDETVTDAASFTYGDVVTASLEWQQYTNTFPAGTKRIAIKYIYNDAYFLFLDDFTFEDPSGCLTPTGLTITYNGGHTADVSWTSNALQWMIDVNGTQTAVTENPYTLTNLDLATSYTVKVKAFCGITDESGWSPEESFFTDYCELEDQCQISYTLTTTSGYEEYGWLGSYILVVDNETNTLIAALTENSEEGTTSGTLSVCDGRSIRFQWYSGSNYDDLLIGSYTINDVNGIEIAAGTGAMTSNVEYTVNCAELNCPKPTDLAVTNVTEETATLTWTGNSDTYTVRYRESEIFFSEEFENGIPETWTNVYADGDNVGWFALSDVLDYFPDASSYYSDLSAWAYSGSNAVASASYVNTYGAFNVSNWLITPQLDLQGTLKFMVVAQGNYGDEFEVLLSTTTTDTSAFTTVLREMTAASGSYTEVSIDLSEYAGQQGYIAIHHAFNDGYFLVVDNFGIYGEPGEWQEITVNDNTTELSGLTAGMNYEVQVTGVCEGEEPLWSNALMFATESPCEKISLNEANNYTWTEDFEVMGAGITDDPYTGVEPRCWTLVAQYSGAAMNEIGDGVDTLPQVFYNPAFDADGGDYTLRFKFHSLLAMPELDETVDLSRLHLSMYVRQPQSYYHLQVGILEDLDDDSTFEPLAMVDNETTDMEYFECDFSRYTGTGRYIAFKNVGGSSSNPYCSNYLDNITLTYNPVVTCGIEIPADYQEGFEGYATNLGATGVEPDCWEVITPESNLDFSTRPQVYAGFNTTTGGDFTLRMRNRCVYAMPEFAEGVDITALTMTFNLRQPKAVYALQVGVVDADGNFEMVEELNNTTADMEPVAVDFSGYTGNGHRIAFRNVLNGKHYPYSYNYIDDIAFGTSAKSIEAAGDVNDPMDNERYLDNISVYPNPTTGMLYIDAVNVQKVECYNQMGQLVGVYDNENELNLGELSNGVYMLRITVPQGVTMRKVVKR